MKKTKIRKKSKSDIRKIQDDIWYELRRIASIRFANQFGEVDCYTCGARNLQGVNKQLGHMWAKASLSAQLKYDIRILRWQCMRCNCHLGGQGAIFYAKMLEEIGEKAMKELVDIKNKATPVNAMDYYKVLLEKLKLLTE